MSPKSPEPAGTRRLSHIGPDGQARMVDVGAKPVTAREAVARGRVRMSATARRLVQAGTLKKGDAVQTARLAGIMAAKSTATLIPLCHPLPLAAVDVTIAPARDGYTIESRVRTVAQTGVEMEALTAVSVAALTLYDMVKAVDKAMTITDVELVSKRGGQSGDYQRRPTEGSKGRRPGPWILRVGHGTPIKAQAQAPGGPRNVLRRSIFAAQ